MREHPRHAYIPCHSRAPLHQRLCCLMLAHVCGLDCCPRAHGKAHVLPHLSCATSDVISRYLTGWTMHDGITSTAELQTNMPQSTPENLQTRYADVRFCYVLWILIYSGCRLRNSVMCREWCGAAFILNDITLFDDYNHTNSCIVDFTTMYTINGC